MKKILIIVSLVFFISLALAQQKEVKEPVVAGAFYPANPVILSNMIDDFIKDATVEDIDGEIIAVIAPHAGYIYSGGVAAYGFKTIKDKPYKKVIIIAPSHHIWFNGLSVYDRGSFRTPLGDVPVDEDFASRLIHSHEKLFFYKQAYLREHSLEVEIPFLQKVLKDFRIVPVVFGDLSYENCKILGESLAKLLKDKKDFLIVASTDMSHYHPYNEAKAIDEFTIKKLKELDPKALFNEIATRKSELCGGGPVVAAMIAAKELGANKIKILKYANSGDTAGGKDRVVGYVSAVMYKSETENPKEGEESMLNEEQRKRLLQIARETMETYIKTGKRLEVKEDDPVLNREMGAFVTLHRKGQLRGCIGNIIGRGPLYLTVRNMAVESSTADPRFPPVTASELNDIDIEVSVLSELEKIDDPNIIEMGKHGVLVKSDFRSGVFLPQVATETGWSREEFMSNLCSHKAGLPPDAWKTGECEIYIYTAEVFGEK